MRGAHARFPARLHPYGGRTSIVVVDDHPVVREGLIAVLSDEPDFRVVGEADTGEAALREVAGLRPRVVLLDTQLPTMPAQSVCDALLERHPEVRVVLAATFLDRWSIASMVASGAHGLVLKDSEPSTIRDAIRAVARNETYLDPRAAPRITGRRSTSENPFGLTPRELTIVRLLPLGMTNRAIGAELWISEDTVKTHLKAILVKLAARDRAEAAAIAVREGLA